MKFGLHFHTLVIPRWDAHYIDYNGLCQRIRGITNKSSSRNVTELLRCLDERIESFENARIQVLGSVLYFESEMCGVFGLPARPRTLPGIDCADELELDFILGIYLDILQKLKDMQWFDRVNHRAIDRLFAKLGKYDHDDGTLEHIHHRWITRKQVMENDWAETFARVDKLVSEIRQALAQSRVEGHSWCIASLLSYALPAQDVQAMLYQSLKDDQVSLVEENFLSERAQRVIVKDGNECFVGSILLTSIMLSANNTASLVLNRMLPQQMNVEQMFLLIHLYGILSKGRSHKSPELETAHLRRVTDQLAEFLSAWGTDAVGYLEMKDSQGHLLLHHAARYGLDSLCEVMVSHLVSTGGSNVALTLTLVDKFGDTPLHCAVNAVNPRVLAILLSALSTASADDTTKATVRHTLGNVLLLALRTKADEMAQMILDHDVDLLCKLPQGETALYCAARSGNLPMVQILVGRLSEAGHGIDIGEKSRGWTPLMAACANGHTNVAGMLLNSGADQDVCDAHGWRALEHAVFRGHHGTAALFRPNQLSNFQLGPAEANRIVGSSPRLSCSKGEKILVVHLGSTQGGHNRTVIELGSSNGYDISRVRQDCPLELHISLLGMESATKIVQLPMLEDQLQNPLLFKVEQDVRLQIVAKLYRCESVLSRVLVSSGTSVLDQESLLGDKHESLIRERTIYLTDVESSDPTGAVLISYVIAKPFPGLEEVSASNDVKGVEGTVQLVGHRGFGQNVASRSFLQIGENTMMSFLSAAKFGASFVEFDLQVTRDMEAVIYHDFSLSESGTDIPIHDITLPQYKHASNIQEPRTPCSASLNDEPYSTGCPKRKPRSWSSGEESQSRTRRLRDQLQHTLDFQKKGFKPNSRGDVIQDSLITLEELLVKLPLEIGFNIEIKYPRLHEAVEAGVAPVALDINTFVDVALDRIKKYAGRRRIILSSFTPEVCILLSVKQTAYPVMFITNAGKVPMQDKELRAASLQAAVHFCRTWNLSGVVLACETFLYCPRLVQFVKNMGLVCASYGLLNNDPKHAELQAAAGVDILMADRVKLIADHLREQTCRLTELPLRY